MKFALFVPFAFATALASPDREVTRARDPAESRAAIDLNVIAGRPWVRWTFGFAVPIACFAYALSGAVAFLPTDFVVPRSAVLAWALTSLAAMALSTLRRVRAAPASMLLGGLLSAGALFALAHIWWMREEILFALFYFWFFVPLALAPPVAALVYAACAVDEVRRVVGSSRPAWAAFVAGFALPWAVAVLAHGAVRRTESLLIARLVEPESTLDESDLAPLRAFGWIDPWNDIQAVRRTWIQEQPPVYRGRALRARQVLHALTGDYGGPPPGSPAAPDED